VHRHGCDLDPGKEATRCDGFRVSAQGERAAEHPRVYTRIHIEYTVTGRGVDLAAVERAVELSEAKYCSAQAMLSKTAKITHSIQIREAEALV
jgi:putative redox protein